MEADILARLRDKLQRGLFPLASGTWQQGNAQTTVITNEGCEAWNASSTDIYKRFGRLLILSAKYNEAVSAKPRTSRVAEERRLGIAERLRTVLSHWVRTTRDQAGTPSSAKIETLRLLEDAGPLTIAVLAQKRAVKHQSMRLVVEQLAAEGAVGKASDPEDRRNQIVSITSSGQALLKSEQQVRTEWIAGLLQSCTSDELNDVAAALGTLERLLERRAIVVV